MRRRGNAIPFAFNGEERLVDLGAPRPVRRGGRWMVQLIDLWVATMLPGDFLDLTFELDLSGERGRVHRAGPLDALRFAGGLVALHTREIWWDDAGANLNGLRLQGVVASLAEPLRPIAPVQPPLRRSVSVADVRRLLPHVSVPYPFVEWRSIS